MTACVSVSGASTCCENAACQHSGSVAAVGTAKAKPGTEVAAIPEGYHSCSRQCKWTMHGSRPLAD